MVSLRFRMPGQGHQGECEWASFRLSVSAQVKCALGPLTSRGPSLPAPLNFPDTNNQEVEAGPTRPWANLLVPAQ